MLWMNFVRSLVTGVALLCGAGAASAQGNEFTVQGTAANASMSLINSTTGKAVVKNCTAIEPLSVSDSGTDYCLAVITKTLSVFQAATGTALLEEKIKSPTDCYQIKEYPHLGRKIVVVFTTVGRKTFLLGPSGILYPKNTQMIVDDIATRERTTTYLSVAVKMADREYGQGVIDWEGKEELPVVRQTIVEYDHE